MSAGLITKFDYEQAALLLSSSKTANGTIGSFFSGVVTQTSSESKFKTGDKVVGFFPITEGGACSELVTVHSSRLVPIPEGIPFDGAVASAYAGVIALSVLDGRVKPKEGDTLLVTCASSAVGTLIVQLAVVVWKVARVIAVVSSQQEAAVINKLNLPHGTVTTADFHDKGIADGTIAPGGVTHIIDLCSLWTGEKKKPQELNCASVARMLGMQGSWTTFSSNFQLDPPLANVLLAKNTSIHFVSPRMLFSAPSVQGSIMLYTHSALRFVRGETGRSPVRLPVYNIGSSGDPLQFILDKFFDGVVINF